MKSLLRDEIRELVKEELAGVKNNAFKGIIYELFLLIKLIYIIKSLNFIATELISLNK